MACNSTKETKTSDMAVDMTHEKEMLDQGFTKGTIVHSKVEGDCEYTIKLEDGRFFESTDLKQEFMVDGKTVWFTYGALRRMNKCDKASPISIREMK